jgi:hypothetical protein
MKTQKLIMVTSLSMGIITLILASCFNYGVVLCMNICIPQEPFVVNILIGVFSGAFLSFVIALITYLVAKRNHIENLLQSLLVIHNRLASYVMLIGTYEKMPDNEISLVTRANIVDVYNTVIDECKNTKIRLVTENFYSKKAKSHIIPVLDELREQIEFMKPSLEIASGSRVGQLIDGQKENITRNDFTGKIKNITLMMVKKHYKKYYYSFESVLAIKEGDEVET